MLESILFLMFKSRRFSGSHSLCCGFSRVPLTDGTPGPCRAGWDPTHLSRFSQSGPIHNAVLAQSFACRVSSAQVKALGHLHLSPLQRKVLRSLWDQGKQSPRNSLSQQALQEPREPDWVLCFLLTALQHTSLVDLPAGMVLKSFCERSKLTCSRLCSAA